MYIVYNIVYIGEKILLSWSFGLCGTSRTVCQRTLNDEQFLEVRLQYVVLQLYKWFSNTYGLWYWDIIVSNVGIELISAHYYHRSCLSYSRNRRKPRFHISFVDSISSFPTFNQFLVALLVDSLGWMNRAGFAVSPPIYWFSQFPLFLINHA